MSGNPFLAMVTLTDTSGPGVTKLEQKWQTLWPEAPPLSNITERGPLTTFQIGDRAIAWTQIPQSVGWKHLEGPAACAWYWPDAASVLKTHCSHLLIHLLDQDGRPLENAQLLTRLVAATSQAAEGAGGASGVFWGPGRLVHPPSAFIELAKQMAPGELPLYLWIDFRIEQDELGFLRLFTTGLEALGQPEIEVASFAGEVGELRANVYNIAHYLLETKKPINHGQALGTEEGRRMIGKFMPSMFNPALEVFRLEFEE